MRNANHGGIARGSAAFRMEGPGVNIEWAYPESYSFYFTNIMKQHGNYLRSAGSYTEDATTGWPTNVAAGTTFTFFLTTRLALTPAYVRPGTYKARLSSAMQAAGWTCQFLNQSLSPNASVISSISAAGGTCTCVINDLGASGDYQNTVLNLQVFAPPSGGPYNFTPLNSTAVEVYLSSNEGRLDAYNSDPVTNYANMFDPDLLASLSGYKVLRFKDWTGTDLSAMNDTFSDGHTYRNRTSIFKYSLCKQEAWRTWQMPGNNPFYTWPADQIVYCNGGQTPFSVCAKLARAVGAAAMIALPTMMNAIPYSVSAATDVFTAYGHCFLDGDQIVLGTSGVLSPSVNGLPTFSGTPAAMWTIYYARDVVPGVSFKLARTLGGAAIDVTADLDDAGNYVVFAHRLYSHAEYMSLYTSIAQEMYAAAPGIDIILDVGNELWNSALPYTNNLHNTFDCVTTNANGQINLGSGYAWMCMRAWAAFESVYPRSQIVRTMQGQGTYASNPMHAQMYAYTDDILYLGKTAGQLVDTHNGEFYVYSNMTGKAFPSSDGGFVSAPFTWGGSWFSGVVYNVGDIIHIDDGNNYRCILQHTSAFPTNYPPNITYWVVDSSNGLTGLVKNYTTAQFQEYAHLGALAASKFRIDYKTAQDAYIGSRQISFINYESGWVMYGQAVSSFAYPDVQAVNTAWSTFWSGSNAYLAVKDFGNALKSANVRMSCYFGHSGRWRNISGTDALCFGLTRSHHLPDSEAAKEWKKWRP